MVAASSVAATGAFAAYAWWAGHTPPHIEVIGISRPGKAKASTIDDVYVDAAARHFTANLLSWSEESRNRRLVAAFHMLDPACRAGMKRWASGFGKAAELFERAQTWKPEQVTVTRLQPGLWSVQCTGMIESYYGAIQAGSDPARVNLLCEFREPTQGNPLVITFVGVEMSAPPQPKTNKGNT
jgi:hypothetical protein